MHDSKTPWTEERVHKSLRTVVQKTFDENLLRMARIHTRVMETLFEPMMRPSTQVERSAHYRQACLIALPTFLAILIDTEKTYLEYALRVIEGLDKLFVPAPDACKCCLLLPEGTQHRKRSALAVRKVWLGPKLPAVPGGSKIRLVQEHVDRIRSLLRASRKLKAALHFVVEVICPFARSFCVKPSNARLFLPP